VLACLAAVGMTIRQLPSSAFHSPADYETAMATIHDRYDAAFGTAVVDLLERLQVFRMFSSTWFTIGLLVLITSIIVCTIDRIPRLWKQSTDIRVVQPEPFFDPRLPDRAATTGIAADRVAAVFRHHRFRLRREVADGTEYVYGDRHQYTKMATLLTHLGLILFLVAAAVTWKLGDEQGLVVAEGDALTVQPIGTPGLLLVRNLDFEAPGFESGRATDFTTDLAVYQDGREIARKTIRVNDPLSVAGYTFHQNGFGPAPDLLIRDSKGGILWSGPVALTNQANGLPYDTMAVPGRDMGLEMLLTRDANGVGTLITVPYKVTGGAAGGGTPGGDAQPTVERAGVMPLQVGEPFTLDNIDFSVEVRSFSDFTLLIAKRDPGQGLVWLAFVSLISGIVITFYFPRRRVWARIAPDGRVGIVGRSDRYVDFDREFGRLLDDLVAQRSG
jgi:cytochrome c biogenesis protein